MFKHSTTTAALTAALTLTAFGHANGFDTKAGSDEAGPNAPHTGTQEKVPAAQTPAGHGDIFGGSYDKDRTIPGFKNKIRAAEGTMSRSSETGTEPVESNGRGEPGVGNEAAGAGGTSGGLGIGDERGPGLGQGNPDGTSGGPLGNEYEKPAQQPGLGQGDGPELDRLDIDGDGHVDFMDIVTLLSEWGRNHGRADLTGDGTVGMRDLGQLLSGMPAMIYEPAVEGPTGSKAPEQRDFNRKGGAQKIDFGH